MKYENVDYGLWGLRYYGDEHGWAVFTDDKKYRPELGRCWDKDKPSMLACMLNPSKADHLQLDNTVRKMVGIAEREGCGGLIVVNMYDLVSTDPRALLKGEPASRFNNEMIQMRVSQCKVVVAGWGVQKKVPRFFDRAVTVTNLLSAWRPVFCLGLTKEGFPRHPLYVRNDQPLQLFRAQQESAPRESAA